MSRLGLWIGNFSAFDFFWGHFIDGRIEEGDKPKFRAINFILFADLDLEKNIMKENENY